MVERGLIHLYTGEGKGKTTAAVGLAVRALGAGMKVLFIPFMKGGSSSEWKQLQLLGIDFRQPKTGDKFVFQMDDEEKAACRTAHTSCFTELGASAHQWDMVVLDEAISAVTTGMLTEKELVNFLENKPAHLEVILTGRDAPLSIKEISDYITNMIEEKHPYNEGVMARLGIEY